MINVTSLLCPGASLGGHHLRYHPSARDQRYGTSPGRGPVVVWNMTRACNLRCLHCYAAARERHPAELTTREAQKLIDDLAAFKVPVLLFSGGEPLLREDFFELASYAAARGLRTVLSTNGTLIDRRTAGQLRDAGISYVGVSLDGVGETNDRFRGQKGAFEAALAGIRSCLETGLRVGIRFTLNRHNYAQLPAIFTLITEEGIPRACFYHLVYSGRARHMVNEDLSHEETRAALDLIMEKAAALCRTGREILTVDNHADGPYIYLKVYRREPQKAAEIYRLLLQNGGNRSGMAIAAVDWEGNVHPDQFTQHHVLGNVRQRSFGQIWTDDSHPLLRGLRNRKSLLRGRCSRCRFLEVCNGNFRSRAEAVHGDFWAPDPACYLTEEEIKPA